MSENPHTDTSLTDPTSMTEGGEVDQENLLDEQDLNQGEPEQESAQERDELDELLDSDPQMREAVKAEMKRRLMGQEQPVQQQPVEPEPTQLDMVQQQIVENDRQLDAFFETPEAERNYEQFERLKIQQRRLERQEREAREAHMRQREALSRSDQVIESWIRQRAATDRGVLEYQDRIKQIASGLRPDIRADEGALRQALEYMVLPNAFMQHSQAQRARQGRRQPQRRDAPPGEAYMDDDADDRPKRRDKYADASAEEREFLRRVGLLKDESSRGRQNDGLIPMKDGYVIPITRGRRNGDN